MKSKIFILKILLMLVGFTLIPQISAFCSSGDQNTIKPFRVMVIIGDQWQDPMSYMVTKPEQPDESIGIYPKLDMVGPNDFHHLMILLKSWSIPFDVVRLDQQFLDRNMFLDMDGKPMYGTIIWDVNNSDKLLHPDYSILKRMVQDYGIGLVALSDCIFPAEIQDLLGLKYTGSWESKDEMKVVQEHFLTEGLHSTFSVDDGIWGFMKRPQIEVLEGATTLVKHGSYPMITARKLETNARTVWIGHDRNYMFYFQDIRTSLRRAITWTIGYNLYKTWEKDIIMRMDDPGNAQNAWSQDFDSETLSEEVIEKYLIKPLQEHNAVLNINFLPGFVNDEKRWIEPSWQRQFTDEFGTAQDYVSSKRGYDKGVKLGVFEVMCHGLTHMQPDLTSPPGWWGTELDQERAQVGWYREFGDTRRHKEIPAAEQFWRMKTAQRWLEKQFGVTPLEFSPGGGGRSTSYENNTYRIAARSGFGWLNGYLGPDMLIPGWEFQGTPDSPKFIGSRPGAHDRGITRDPDEFATVFDDYPDSRFIGINEYIGYMHASNSGQLVTGKKPQLTFTVDYDPHYCLHFAEQASAWILELSDWVTNELGETPIIKVDGKAISFSKASYMIPIPAGIGKHYIEISR